MDSTRSPRPLRVDGRLIVPELNRIEFEGRQRTLEPKVVEVLLRLAVEPGRVISREELIEAVWNGDHVTDDVLTRAVGELRRCFDDDPRKPRVIETIRQRGYRLIAEVEEVAGDAATPPEARTALAATGSRNFSTTVFATLGVLGVVGVVAAVAMLGFEAPALDGPSPDVSANFERRGLRIAPLTSSVRQERDPAVSPDGSRVAYAEVGEDGRANLWVQARRGGERRMVTDGPEEDRYPVWSPDGNRLAFVRLDDSGGCQRLILSLLSGDQRRLSDCEARAPLRADWSPDGRYLALVDRIDSVWGVHLLDLETLASQPLTRPAPPARGDLEPTFSPDGTLVAFTRLEGSASGDLWVVSLVDREETRLTFDRRDILGQAFEHDGAGIVFSSDRAGSYGLWRVPTTGGSPRWLAGSGNKIKHPSHARSAPVVVWEDWRFAISIVTQDLDRPGAPGKEAEAGSEDVVVSTQWDFAPAISPSGDRLAFVSSRSGNHQVWVRPLSATTGDEDPIQLTREPLRVTSAPAWSPDGSRLAFAALRGAEQGLWLLDLDTRSARPLRTGHSYVRSPRWSPDGASILFTASGSDGRSALYRVYRSGDSGTGGADAELVRSDVVAVREDGAGALWLVRASRDGLWRIRSAGGGEGLELVTEAFPRRAAARWDLVRAPDESSEIVVWVEADEEGAWAVRLDSASGRTTRTRLGDVARPGVSLSPDGSRLFYSVSRDAEADLVLGERLPRS